MCRELRGFGVETRKPWMIVFGKRNGRCSSRAELTGVEVVTGMAE